MVNATMINQGQMGPGASHIPSSGSNMGGLIKKKQVRQDEVNDAFYEQLVYENLEMIIRKYQLLQKEKNEEAAEQQRLLDEAEDSKMQEINLLETEGTESSVDSKEAKESEKKEKKKKKIQKFGYEILQEEKEKEGLPHPTTIESNLKE